MEVNPGAVLPPSVVAPVATPVLLGYVLNWGLFGALTIQIYLYHVSFPGDRPFAKGMVYMLFLVETAQTILITHDAFNAYVRLYGNLSELNEMQNEWLAVPVLSALVSGAVQLYYGYRLSVLSGSWRLRSLVSLIAMVQGISGIVCGVQAFKIGTFSELADKEFVSTSIWLAGCALCDIIIAASMGYHLVKRTSLARKPEHIGISLVRCVVETGSLTALTATIDLILFLAFPKNAYHACIALILAKLYSNSLLVMFNSQIRIVGARNWTPAVTSSEESARAQSTAWSGESSGTTNEGSREGKTTRVVLRPQDVMGTLKDVRKETDSWGEVIEMNDKTLNIPTISQP